MRLPGTKSREAHQVEALNLFRDILMVDPEHPGMQKILTQMEDQNHIIPQARTRVRVPQRAA